MSELRSGTSSFCLFFFVTREILVDLQVGEGGFFYTIVLLLSEGWGDMDLSCLFSLFFFLAAGNSSSFIVLPKWGGVFFFFFSLAFPFYFFFLRSIKSKFNILPHVVSLFTTTELGLSGNKLTVLPRETEPNILAKLPVCYGFSGDFTMAFVVGSL